ncbi:MAG: hypothetical protein ACLTGI_06165 [Hoylesella buccalis]
MEKVIARVEREVGEKNFSCYMKVKSVNACVLGRGNTSNAAIADMLQGWNETKEDLKEDGIEVSPIEIEYTFDIGALFNYYDFINVAGVSREIGISSAVMRQYATGVRRPSKERKERIVKGIKSLAKKWKWQRSIDKPLNALCFNILNELFEPSARECRRLLSLVEIFRVIICQLSQSF